MSKPFAIISYAIREADGISNLIDFLNSLSQFKLSPNNQVVIALKESSELFYFEVKKHVQKNKGKIPHVRIMHVPAGGYDIGSHFHVAMNNSCQVLIFMSASSMANVKGWDIFLTEKFKDSTIGIIGSMYSNESIKTSYLDLLDLHLKNKFHIAFSKNDRAVARIRGVHQNYPIYFKSPGFFLHFLLRNSRRWIMYLNKNKEPFNYIMSFPDFPNPHIRTTGFAIRRDLFLAVIDRIPENKADAFRFESGYQSIVRRSFNLGWRVLTVDKKQQYFEIDDKSVPSTFRVVEGDSIVTDHVSRSFHKLSISDQKILSSMTHGKTILK